MGGGDPVVTMRAGNCHPTCLHILVSCLPAWTAPPASCSQQRLPSCCAHARLPSSPEPACRAPPPSPLCAKQIGKIIGNKWKELDEEGKKPYVEQAAKDKVRHAVASRVGAVLCCLCVERLWLWGAVGCGAEELTMNAWARQPS